MALQRLTESYSFDSDTFQKIVSSHKITESELKAIPAEKLSEETKKFLEKDSNINLLGKTVWRVPVSRYDWKNANGRVYEKKLWQNVIDKQKESWQGNVGLADHPLDEEDGSFRNVATVWLNMGLNETEQIVWGECVFVGAHGKLAEEIMEAGGRVGFSSSGFGELDEFDKSTVKWDSYMIERVSDLVLNPSQKVFGRRENRVTHESIKESDDSKKSEITKCDTCGCEMDKCECEKSSDKEKKSDNKQENTIMAHESDTNSKMSKFEVKRIQEEITHYLGEVNQKEDLQEKLDELQEIRQYFSANVPPKLLAEIDKEIKETREAIDSAIKEHGKIAATFGVTSVEALKEGVKRLAVDTQFYERDASDWKKITEGLQEKIKMLQAVISTRPTVESYKGLLIEMQTLKQEKETEFKNLSGYVAQLKEKVVSQEKIEEQLVLELEDISAENARITEYANTLKAYGLKMKEKLGTVRESQKAVHDVIEEKKLNESIIHFRPESTAAVTGFTGFSEADEIEDYYENLEMRYGKTITPFKEKILGCKTVREAMLLFNKVFVESKKIEKISEALEMGERQKILEATSGGKFQTHRKMDSRVPEGWD